MDQHSAKLQQRCRVCGNLLVAKGKRKKPSYKCTEFSERLSSVFSIYITNDVLEIHPLLFCYLCKQVMDRCTTHYSSTNIYQWEAHTDEGCMVKKLICILICTCTVYMYMHMKCIMLHPDLSTYERCKEYTTTSKRSSNKN